jgi:hypothetical protein
MSEAGSKMWLPQKAIEDMFEHVGRGYRMITVENDWIEYETTTARRAGVRGGAACAARVPVVRSDVRAQSAARHGGRAPSPARVQVARAEPLALPAASAARRRLRLTRRGRFVLVVLPSVLAATCALVAATGPLSEAQAAPRATRWVTVAAGDSLWSIAERIAPGADPRDVVAELERANGLPDAAVAAGERLVLPSGVAGR